MATPFRLRDLGRWILTVRNTCTYLGTVLHVSLAVPAIVRAHKIRLLTLKILYHEEGWCLLYSDCPSHDLRAQPKVSDLLPLLVTPPEVRDLPQILQAISVHQEMVSSFQKITRSSLALMTHFLWPLSMACRLAKEWDTGKVTMSTCAQEGQGCWDNATLPLGTLTLCTCELHVAVGLDPFTVFCPLRAAA